MHKTHSCMKKHRLPEALIWPSIKYITDIQIAQKEDKSHGKSRKACLF
ncbi:hypothetical protein PJ15_0673 [Acinetobacter sp. neg1]|nr:hypothetical protein PJ15_0673 [Acinetobacter sp. neg1]